jgi:hypothetical protein
MKELLGTDREINFISLFLKARIKYSESVWVDCAMSCFITYPKQKEGHNILPIDYRNYSFKCFNSSFKLYSQ